MTATTSRPASASTAKPAAAKPAGAATPATSGETAAKKYPTMILGLSESRKPTHKRLTGLATQLGCRVSDLVWSAVETMLANPPKVAPAGSSQTNSTAAGFWVLHTYADNGRLSGVRVVEVDRRGDIDGGDRLFVRYSKDAENADKVRNRARDNAVRAAQYDLKIAGISQEVKVEKHRA